MKTFATLSFLFLSVTCFAQNNIPAKEFSVSLSESAVSVKPGEKGQVTVSLLKSKAYAKSDVKMGVSNSLPAGITLQFDQAEGNIESAVAIISVGSDVAAGTYQIIVNSTINHKTKGSILKLTVGNDNVASRE